MTGVLQAEDHARMNLNEILTALHLPRPRQSAALRGLPHPLTTSFQVGHPGFVVHLTDGAQSVREELHRGVVARPQTWDCTVDERYSVLLRPSTGLKISLQCSCQPLLVLENPSH